MSIPRFAIQRPVMMTMISSIIILLGTISLSRLPVDLLPDISQPTINVRVNYTGVGPLEMEELITRPLEQQLSAVAGLEQINSTSSEGNSNIQLNFTWGHDLNEAMDDIRTRIDRVKARLPEDAPRLRRADAHHVAEICADRDPLAADRRHTRADADRQPARQAGVDRGLPRGGVRRDPLLPRPDRRGTDRDRRQGDHRVPAEMSSALPAGESIRVRGIVQGVGFRPFVHGLARRLDLSGWVCNDSDGVLLEVQGAGVAAFLERLPRETVAAWAERNRGQPLRRGDSFVTGEFRVTATEVGAETATTMPAPRFSQESSLSG
mgnify:CR=1 FL=1